jgi:hypothetical protein
MNNQLNDVFFSKKTSIKLNDDRFLFSFLFFGKMSDQLNDVFFLEKQTQM